MSVLNGKISNETIYSEKPPFGERLKETMLFPLKKCHDIELDENAEYAFVLHEGGLSVYDIRNPGSPALVSTLSDIHEGREIKISKKIAYVAARAEGLYIVDVSNLYETFSAIDSPVTALTLFLSTDTIYLTPRLRSFVNVRIMPFSFADCVT